VFHRSIWRRSASKLQAGSGRSKIAGVKSLVRATVGAGLLIGLVALAFALAQSPVSVARTSTPKDDFVGLAHTRTEACQKGEVLPRSTSAIRLTMNAFTGPRVAIEVRSRERVIARGERGSGWTGGVVTVPIRPLPITQSDVTLCFAIYLNGYETGYLSGERTAPIVAATGPSGAFPGRVRAEYLRTDGPSWWSLAGEVARRMGLGHAGSGTWSVLLAAALMVGVVLVCTRTALRELG
jgi:hypothetical protein